VGRRQPDPPAVPTDGDDARCARHGAGPAGAVDDLEALVDRARGEPGPAAADGELRGAARRRAFGEAEAFAGWERRASRAGLGERAAFGQDEDGGRGCAADLDLVPAEAR
jgi:hypothetical protein